jgi:hypothetical protein
VTKESIKLKSSKRVALKDFMAAVSVATVKT